MGGLDPTPPALRRTSQGGWRGRIQSPEMWWWGFSGRAWAGRDRASKHQKDRGRRQAERQRHKRQRQETGKRRSASGQAEADGGGKRGTASGLRGGKWCVVSGRGGTLRGPGWRSVEALRWLSRLDVAGIEALGCAFGWRRSATYSHLQRLADAGYVIRAFDPGGSVVAITAAGRRWIGAERGDVRAGATYGSGLRHARAVSWVAALLTLRERAWVSERESRGRPEWEIPVIWPAHRGRHRPDLGAVMGSGARVAIEVELLAEGAAATGGDPVRARARHHHGADRRRRDLRLRSPRRRGGGGAGSGASGTAGWAVPPATPRGCPGRGPLPDIRRVGGERRGAKPDGGSRDRRGRRSGHVGRA